MHVLSRSVKTTVAVCLLALMTATPAMAFDGRSGERIVIAADQVVNDDLYVGASEFVMDGTVNGDVIAAGQILTINGTVNGNFIAAAQTVIVNGTVTGDVLAAGSVLLWGAESKVGGDIVSAGASLELRKGASVGRDAILAAGQILLGGDVGRNVRAGAEGVEIDGRVGGNVQAYVGEAGGRRSGPAPGAFAGQSPIPVPQVNAGLTIDPGAHISGALEYTQTRDLAFPGGVVAGSISRLEPPQPEGQVPRQETPADRAGKWALASLRGIITVLLLGLLLLLVAPRFVKGLSAQIEGKPWSSLGWGAVAYAAFFFLILLILFVSIVAAVIFGLLTLTGLTGTIVWLAILALFALIVGFVLITSFVAKIAFGDALGRWILRQAHSSAAEHRYWPMVLGVSITIAIVALVSFPSIPGALGWVLNFAVILFGLGAFAIWVRGALRGTGKTAA
jgi:cytoskeletal protein CcmA (bactofilin family)